MDNSFKTYGPINVIIRVEKLIVNTNWRKFSLLS
jgi:hypothetical protein